MDFSILKEKAERLEGLSKELRKLENLKKEVKKDGKQSVLITVYHKAEAKSKLNMDKEVVDVILHYVENQIDILKKDLAKFIAGNKI